MYSFELQKRFWSNVLIKNINDCWIWNRYLDKDGYGNFYFNGGVKKAHRFAYEIYNILDNTFEVCHTCDNPSCVNPLHLYSGTHLENMREMKEKGRSRVSLGDNNVNVKISEQELREAFDLILAGEISDKLDLIDYNENFTENIIRKIRNKVTWKHVTDEYTDEEFEHIRDRLNGRVTRTDAYLIKQDSKNFTNVQIAKMYELNEHTVSQIVNGYHKYS